MKFVDLTGKELGHWKVLKRVSNDRNEMSRYECQCDCGLISVVYAKHLKSKNSKSCHACTVKKGQDHHQWKGHEDMPGWYWHHILRHSKSTNRKRIELLITIEDAWNQFLKQDKKCALSGVELILPTSRKDRNMCTASLDRIDSGGPYSKDNIQWIHKHLNWMKNTFDQNYFIGMCAKVANHSGACPIDFKKQAVA